MSGSEQRLGSTDQRIAANEKQIRNDLWMLEVKNWTSASATRRTLTSEDVIRIDLQFLP